MHVDVVLQIAVPFLLAPGWIVCLGRGVESKRYNWSVLAEAYLPMALPPLSITLLIGASLIRISVLTRLGITIAFFNGEMELPTSRKIRSGAGAMM